MTNVSISKIMQMILNWLEPKIGIPICEHPQVHNRLGWKPYKNSLIISHHYFYSVITCIYLCVAFPKAFFPHSFYSSQISHLFHVPFFKISLINAVMLIMFAFDFICIFNLHLSNSEKMIFRLTSKYNFSR